MHPSNLQEMKSLLILPVSAIVSVKKYILPSIKKQYGNILNPRFTIFAKSFWFAHTVLVNEAELKFAKLH